MNLPDGLFSPITDEHLARWAEVYVRQSCIGQVRRHGESTDLQYQLVEQVVAWGWPRDRIHVVDNDLGQSGTSAEGRELRVALPVGLTRLPHGEVVINPDEEVQARLNLVFRKLKELGTGCAVVRYCRREELLLPAWPLRGPAPHEIVWQPATISRVLDILKNPAYAGVYAFGQTMRDSTRRKGGHPHSGIVHLPSVRA